jgi:Zn-dependent peptidase ImmA (M78 family)/transcriptional regulator with XRE-family HTH domain
VSQVEARAASTIFDPQRLKVARQLRKLSRTELAKQIGVSAAAVGQWESGEIRPRPQTLVELASSLEFPVAYFATSGRKLSNLDSDCTFFRSLRKSKQIDRDAAMAHAVLIAEFVIVIERHAALPPVSIPLIALDADVGSEQIDVTARDIRDAWGLGDEPISDVLRELERHGAVAARLELAEAVDAFSWPGSGRPIVILGADKGDRARSRFDAAHELGHIVMHREQPKPGDPQLERQAHRFASAFLLPTERLHAEWPSGRLNWRELMALKRRWQMSLAALLYRAREDQLLSGTAYESAIKYMSRAGWRKSEPGDLGPPERPRLLRRAVRALEAADITLDDLTAEAHLPSGLVHDYLRSGVAGRIRVEL